MKLLFAIFTIFIAYFISSAEADCSTNSWKPVHNFAANQILGRWYAILRFTNGKDTSDCLWHNLKIHPTIPNAVQEIAVRTFKNGKGRRRHEIEGVLTAADTNSSDGVIRVVFKKGSNVLKYITYADYDNFAIVRSCFKGEEYFWVYSRNIYPSNSTITKMYEEMDNQGIDLSKVIKSCGVLASDVV